MITVEFFVGMAFIDVVLIIYSFLDIDNRMYGNIITSFFASFLSFILAAKLVARNVIYKAPDQLMTYSNTTLQELPTSDFTSTIYVYTEINYFFETRSFSLFFTALGVAMAIVTLGFIIDEILRRTKEI